MFFKTAIGFDALLLSCIVLMVSGLMKEGTNAVQYGILCDIYNVAANPPSYLYDPSETEKIRSESDVINASLSEDNSFRAIAYQKFQENLSVEFKEQANEGASFLKRWTIAVTKVSSNSTRFQKVPSNDPFVKRAQKKLKNIVENVEKIIKNIEATNSAANLGGIKKDFSEAIGKVGNSTATSYRAMECGNPGQGIAGSRAGSFLIMDFLCLCGRLWYSDGLPNVCGPDLKDNRWDKKLDNGTCKPDDEGGETWKILKQGCENRGSTKLADPSAGYAALGEFLTAVLKESTIDGNNKPGLLGSMNAQGGGRGSTPCQSGISGCTGRNCQKNGACVYYGDSRKDGGKYIPWVKNYKSGLEKLERIQHKNASIQADITLLKMLQIRAEEIYEDAKAISELEKNNPEEGTADNTTQNDSYHIRSFPLWTLLI